MKNKHFLPAFFFGVLILVGSSMPTEKLEKLQESNDFSNVILSDYSLHFLAFGIFTALLCYGFYRRRYHTFSFFWIGFISLSFGLFIELYQILLPNRAFNPYDLIPDFAGILISLILFKIFMRIL